MLNRCDIIIVTFIIISSLCIEQAWDKFLKYATSLQVSLTQTLESRHIGMLSETQRGTRVSMILHLLSRGSERKRLQKIRKEFLESVEMAQGKRSVRLDRECDDDNDMF